MDDLKFREGDIIQDHEGNIGEIIGIFRNTSVFDYKIRWKDGSESGKFESYLTLLSRNCRYHDMKMLYNDKEEKFFCPVCKRRKKEYETKKLPEFQNES